MAQADPVLRTCSAQGRFVVGLVRVQSKAMNPSTPERMRLADLDRQALSAHQVERFNALLAVIRPGNPLYRAKLAEAPERIGALAELAQYPLTTKAELQAPGGGPGPNLTFPIERYTRFHQTSGTTGQPLMVYDTPADWQAWIECWHWVLDRGGVTTHDRVLLAFSYGPFIGFWAAHDAVVDRGCLVLPGGGMSSLSRLMMALNIQATVLMCTPSYALHLGEIADQHGIDLRANAVRTIIVAGEPGGSLPSVRQRIETLWDAQLIDHSGASEVGAWGFADAQGRGLLVNEAHFIPEFLSLEDHRPAQEGELAELVLTGLSRPGFPVVRYRTGDLVRPVWSHGQGCGFVLLDGGVLGRADDMVIVRGVNIFPSALDEILRGFPEIQEYRITATRAAEMDQLSVEIEHPDGQAADVAAALRTRLGLRIDVRCVPCGSLPRFEAKGRRFVDRRRATSDPAEANESPT